MPEETDLVLLMSLFGAYKSKKIEGRTRIQKLVCILKYREGFPVSFDFKPYFYGPYSDKLSDELNTLISLKLINETANYIGNGSFRYDYSLTDNGNKFIKKIEERSPTLINLLKGKIEILEEMNTSDLVKEAKRISGINSI